jgi:uncharacterized protein (TIGR03435 family)
VLTVCALLLAVQSEPSFEVASIKPTGPAPNFFSSSPDRFVRGNITLSGLLVYAYDVVEFQIQGGPDWVRTSRFDIEAKADGRPTAEEMRSMVKRLLAERFNLKVHIETQELPRYALVKARSDGRLGDKLRPSASDCSAPPDSRPPTPPRPGEVPPFFVMYRMGGGVRAMKMNGRPISQLIRSIQVDAGRIVVDKTGLTGIYDIELETELLQRPGIPAQVAQTVTPREGLSLFTALQEQLGLKLEPERGPVDVLIIDRVEKPTPD